MKIVITAQGESPDSEVDPRFGRARYFIVYDTDTDTYTLISNTENIQAQQGAGIQAGRMVADAGAQAVLTGNCGPKAFRTLQGADIKVYIGAKGMVRDAVESFKKCELAEAQEPNVEGHW